MFKKLSILLLLSSISFSGILSQQTLFDKENLLYNKALELYEKEKFVAAQQCFYQLVSDPELSHSLVRTNAEYYTVLCALELFNENAVEAAEDFLHQHPETANRDALYFKLGNHLYFQKKYKQALSFFQLVNKADLDEDTRAELYFKSGYSYFLLDSLDKARKAFFEIKDIDTRYAPPAIYYYSHIAYTQKNFETAIAGFTRLKDDESFGPLVPYYIAQCYYYQDKFDDLLSYAPPLLDSVVASRVGELARMIGDAYYHKQAFRDAIPYYTMYFEKGSNFQKQDYYQAGYCYYTEHDYAKAIQAFEKAATDTTALAQKASYQLGDCYIKTNEKDKALFAFSTAAKIDADLKIKEDASFNYAVLSFELANAPFNSSIKALAEYITTYPDSHRSDEAYNYLVTACLNTHSYQEALTYIEKIKNKDKKIKKAYQRAAFYRGLELYNNLETEASTKLFETSLRYPDMDALVTARAFYWLAEAKYRLGNVDEAYDNYTLFTSQPESKKCYENNIVSYNLAYCHFHKKEYHEALTLLKTFTDIQKNKKTKLVADAYNRIGDCLFSETSYKPALEYYSKAIEMALSDKDYAMYQKAFTLGLLADYKKKIQLLGQILADMPESGYCDDAQYETGRSYVALQKPDEATKTFLELISSYPSSSFVKKALLQLGLIEFNGGRNLAAIDYYKKVIADYQATPEARSALTGIKTIYVEMNEVDTYLKYTETLGGFANVGKAEQDSLLYYAAENLYTAKDFKKANDNFGKYIEKFPEGNFILNAWYYKGDCSLRANEYADALIAFTYITGKPRNVFTEQAFVAAARLNVDKKDYNAALILFEALDSLAETDEHQLESRLGIIISQFHLSRYTETIEASQRLLKTPGIPQEAERNAWYYQAKALLAIGEHQKAIDILTKSAKDVKNVMGAESKYLLAKTYFDINKLQKAEKEVIGFIDMNSPHQYWIAKAYILLATIYHTKKDDFQASHTLQSIIENYDGKDDGIAAEAMALKDTYDGKVAATAIENMPAEEDSTTEDF